VLVNIQPIPRSKAEFPHGSCTSLMEPLNTNAPRTVSQLTPSVPMIWCITKTIIFDFAGEQIPLELFAGFADGTTLSVTASSYVTYSSSNTAVATVDSTGLVTAVGPGSGSVTVTYALASNNNQIFVPVRVPNPVNTAAPAPTITNLSPGSGAVGTSVTIRGTNFGASQGTSTVTFNGTAATPTSWSATSIAVPVPSGATTGNVAVTVGGHASSGMRFVSKRERPQWQGTALRRRPCQN
jgi:hypothetical protein